MFEYLNSSQNLTFYISTIFLHFRDIDLIKNIHEETIEVVAHKKQNVKFENAALGSKVAKDRTLKDRAKEAIDEARRQKSELDKDDYRKRRDLQEQEKKVSAF